ncbi:hypothetical protein F2Q69_00030186 [Brassica cretica]|uniref:Uncharacterized protein n=1 Tax=Brassica cretica TaxID=69181 RepID=A0A8S9RYM3_BRACR|nr:hypothetical protein F2Q69_00030186 [Brassica cretica]
MNPELLMFPSSLVGGRPRPRRPFTDPFSSYVPSWGDVPEADSEAVPMAPLRRRRSYFFDDGPRSEIREGDLANMRRKYAVHPSVGMRCPSEFERAPDGGAVRCLSMRHIWKQASGILYSYYFAPLVNKEGYQGQLPLRDGWNSRYVFVKIQEPFGYPMSWRTVGKCVPPGFLCWRSSSKAYNGSSSTIPMGNVVNLPVSAIYDEQQKAKTRKRRPLYTPPPRLARAASLVNGSSSTSSTVAEAVSNHDPLVDAHRRLIGEVFFLRNQVQNMLAHRDLLIQQVKASARWELMKEWLEKRVEHWDPEEEYCRHLFLSGGADQQAGSFSQVATPRSVVGSRFSEDPSFRMIFVSETLSFVESPCLE